MEALSSPAEPGLEHPPQTSYMVLCALQGRLMGPRSACYHASGYYHPHFLDEELEAHGLRVTHGGGGPSSPLSEKSGTLLP